ncbi:hypothetical protein [Flavisolibacter ginsenosidimutans]|uniref:Uncharacterized protein n=1 Tax=Flavisolibacter ginsenosidimutans TaxID=661481 RepID=A0A5B8UI19_9BACT|nr:hypothetical protein [Flavisolibacter ginsenosidimutans]QEC56072.1 hypothetical protein FSB75_09250 [Flavisolibacter ginsenosidimutans]
MSKIIYVNRQQSNQSFASLSVSRPTQPGTQKQPVTEKRIADPSSCVPHGQCYPIPSFFEYRAKPKEFDTF